MYTQLAGIDWTKNNNIFICIFDATVCKSRIIEHRYSFVFRLLRIICVNVGTMNSFRCHWMELFLNWNRMPCMFAPHCPKRCKIIAHTNLDSTYIEQWIWVCLQIFRIFPLLNAIVCYKKAKKKLLLILSSSKFVRPIGHGFSNSFESI